LLGGKDGNSKRLLVTSQKRLVECRDKKSVRTCTVEYKKAIDLAVFKHTLYVKLPSGHAHTDTEPASPHIDVAGDLVLPTYFCPVDGLVDMLRGLDVFKGLSVVPLTDERHIAVEIIN
jgi:hypothetical protein